MEVKYRVVSDDGEVKEEQYFESICCDDMRKALLNQETSLTDSAAVLWLYCPFCKAEIVY